MAEVGKNIKRIRKEKNLTQEDLAERLHCTRQTISNYENGKSEPSIELLLEIAGVLEVEINDLIYGIKKKADRKKRKIVIVILLTAAVGMQAAVWILTPLARDLGWKQFIWEPMFLLRYVLRASAMTLFGWSVAEAFKEMAGIRIWERKSEKTKKIVRVVYAVLVVCLIVTVVLTLWMGGEMAYQWYLSWKMMKAQGYFSSSAVPHLMPEQLASGILHFYVLYLDRIGIFGGMCFFLGVAVSFCRIEKGRENLLGN